MDGYPGVGVLVGREVGELVLVACGVSVGVDEGTTVEVEVGVAVGDEEAARYLWGSW